MKRVESLNRMNVVHRPQHRQRQVPPQAIVHAALTAWARRTRLGELWRMSGQELAHAMFAAIPESDPDLLALHDNPIFQELLA